MAAKLRPDPTFYPSPRLAMDAPDEQHAFVALLRPDKKKSDAIAVVDTNSGSKSYGKAVHKVELKAPATKRSWATLTSCASSTTTKS
jgi:methanethiol oxidase